MALKTTQWDPSEYLDSPKSIAAYLEAAFEVVRADYGSPEAFAEKALGLDATARQRLRADLLEG